MHAGLLSRRNLLWSAARAKGDVDAPAMLPPGVTYLNSDTVTQPDYKGSGANPLGRMRSAFCSRPRILGRENRCPNLGNSSCSPGQPSDLELMLLNLLRKLNSVIVTAAVANRLN